MKLVEMTNESNPVVSYEQSSVEYLDDLGAAVFYMKPKPRPCFTPELLTDLFKFHADVAKCVRTDIKCGKQPSVRYKVLASGLEGSFSHGGDLQMFIKRVESQDRDALLKYAKQCIDASYGFSFHNELPVTSIALVQGRAEGGGFEAALSCDVIIAERGTYMSFPEVLFNMFPGMGAYSYLSRRIAPSLAERLIYSGDVYSTESLFEMGVVDILAEPGKGEHELRKYIKGANRKRNALGLLRHVHSKYSYVPYEELLDIARLWVNVVMDLGEKELKTMRRLVHFQNRKQKMNRSVDKAS